MAITPLPPPPSRADSATFAARGDAFMAALPTYVDEFNALQVDVTTKQQTASTAATTATDQATIASAKAVQASSAATAAGDSAFAAAGSEGAALSYKDLAEAAAAAAQAVGVLGIATTAEAQAFVNDIHALTPKKLADAFGLRVGHTFTKNDWAPLPGGLILQWQAVLSHPGGETVPITFPVAFPNECLMVIGVQVGSGSNVVPVISPSTLTKTGCTFSFGTTQASAFGYWAIGR